MPSFYLGSKNTTLLRALFEGKTPVLLDGDGRKKFEDDRNTGVYRIDVKLSINFRVIVLHLVTWPMKPIVRCHLKVPLALGSSNSTGRFDYHFTSQQSAMSASEVLTFFVCGYGIIFFFI